MQIQGTIANVPERFKKTSESLMTVTSNVITELHVHTQAHCYKNSSNVIFPPLSPCP